MKEIVIEIEKRVFNAVYLPYLEDRSRYLVFYGGGSSGKSYFIAQRYIYRLISPGLCNLLVVRNTADTNRKSTFPLLKQVIRQWGLGKYFKINESDMKIRCLLTGNEVAFAGLDDVEKIKSVTFASGELTDIWVEEATEAREADINQLKIRLRGGKSSKQLVLSFNPVNVRHWIKGHFIDSGLATCCFSTYRDNRFLTQADRQALQELKDSDEYMYRVYCLGQWGVVGKSVFDARALLGRLENAPKPLKTGYFQYKYDGLALTDIRWVNDREGCIRIYGLPGFGDYCIGADTAGDGSDFFAAQVLDARTGRQVAALHRRYDADQFTRQLYCLGAYYRQALIGIEANFDSYPIRELQRLGYRRQYERQVEDSYTGRTEKRYGFKTTALTRPTAISRLIEIVREHTYLLADAATMEELLSIIRTEKGRVEAPAGGHDDRMMALAIAYEIRPQALWRQEEIIHLGPRYAFFAERVREREEIGEEMVVI